MLSKLTGTFPVGGVGRSADRLVGHGGRAGTALVRLAVAILAALAVVLAVLAVVSVTVSANGLFGLLIGWGMTVFLVAVSPAVVRAVTGALPVAG